MTQSEYIAALDRDRRRHGRAALLVLLAFHARAYRHALAAARVGADPAQAAYDVLAGNPALGYPGMGPALDRVAAGAFRSGWRRAGLAAGLPPSSPYYDDAGDGLALDSRPSPAPQARATLAGRVAAIARQAAEHARNGLRGALAGVTGGAADVVAKVRGWFRKSGTVLVGAVAAAVPAAARADTLVTPTDRMPVAPVRPPAQPPGVTPVPVRPFRSEAAAEAVATEAVNAGADAGFAAEAGADLTGYRFDATLDAATTAVCRACDGTRLEPGHPWWESHTPRLHWGCRSVRVPLFRAFVPTAVPPAIQAAAGFGRPVVNQFAFEQPHLLVPHAF